MARPTKLTEEVIKKAEEYRDNCPDFIHTIEGLALYLKLHKDTIYSWATQSQESEEKNELKKLFSDVVGDIKQKQANQLIENGLKGDYNASIAKLLLYKHDYAEKSETDMTTGGDKINLTVSFVDGDKVS